jgi:hypothetical protein
LQFAWGVNCYGAAIAASSCLNACLFSRLRGVFCNAFATAVGECVKPPIFLTHSKASPSAIKLLFLLDEIINGSVHTNRSVHAGVIWLANFRYLKASGRPIIF